MKESKSVVAWEGGGGERGGKELQRIMRKLAVMGIKKSVINRLGPREGIRLRNTKTDTEQQGENVGTGSEVK